MGHIELEHSTVDRRGEWLNSRCHVRDFDGALSVEMSALLKTSVVSKSEPTAII